MSHVHLFLRMGGHELAERSNTEWGTCCPHNMETIGVKLKKFE